MKALSQHRNRKLRTESANDMLNTQQSSKQIIRLSMVHYKNKSQNKTKFKKKLIDNNNFTKIEQNYLILIFNDLKTKATSSELE